MNNNADKPLQGKTAIVTGASSGIGNATATALAERGANIVATARRTDRLTQLTTRLKELGVDARASTCDITDLGSVRSTIEEAIDHFGHIDILINNAGYMPNAPVTQGKIEDWKQMVDVNINGVLHATHTLLPHLVKQGHGHIVNISSVAGRRVFPTGAVYCGTKHFVHAFSEGLRAETAKLGIRVTIIAPGLVDTELFDHLPDDDAKQRLKNAAETMRFLEPRDIANACAYALTQPEHVAINEVLVRPAAQEN